MFPCCGIEKGDEMTEEFDEKTLKRADYCLEKCTVCVKGREKGKGLFYLLAKVDNGLGLCPFCKAYKKVYGVPAYEKPPESRV